MPDNGKIAVITGGASGIGLATAKLLADQGWRLVVADVEGPALEEACAAMGGDAQAVGVVTDVRDRRAVDALADAAFDRFGRVDAVFNNAGVSVWGPVTSMTHSDWTWMIDVNLWGPIHGVEAFLPRMIGQEGGGHVLFTSSYAGLVPTVGLAAYTAAKAGVVGMAEVLHRELQPKGIGVSVLCPMIVSTNISTSARNRPEDLGGPLAERETAASPPDDDMFDADLMAAPVLAPDAVAKAVVAAIGTDQLYILPHDEMRKKISQRFEQLDRTFER